MTHGRTGTEFGTRTLPSSSWPPPSAAPYRLAAHSAILALIAAHTPLSETLQTLALLLERELPGARASVLLVAADGRHLSVGAAPSLPPEFNRAVDGEAIGPGRGSCGTAAAQERIVITTDIATDPSWTIWRDAARDAGLAACWSVPFVGAHQQVLGTFGVYFAAPREPRPDELALLHDAGHLAAIAVQQEGTARRLRELSRTDALTGLPNRNVLTDRVRTARARSAESGMPFAILVIGVDRVSGVNESFGLATGDELLALIAQRLVVTAGPSATVARMWGDEFAVLVEDLASPDAAEEIAERLRVAMTAPFDVDGLDLQGSASIGLMVVGPDSSEPDPLRLAGAALERAKATAPGQVIAYEQGWAGSSGRLVNLAPDLRRGLAEHEFELSYQPIVHLASGRIAHYEALLRWTNARRGAVTPEAFVPVAERTGLVGDLGRYALEESLRELQRQRAAPGAAPELGVAVNVSAHQLSDESLPEMVARLLERYALPRGSVTLEVTEGVLLRSGGAGWRALSALREMGARIALDDFGTGFSQLPYLRQFRFDELKIDRSFVADVLADVPARAIVGSVISLAAELGVEVVAEGIEHAEQRDLLLELGADLGQGYLFGPPRPLH